MKDIQWVVQSNLNEGDLVRIEKACRENDVRYTPIQIIPFSDTLPEFDKSIPAVYYGSTTMGKLVMGEPGMFLNNRFNFECYLDKWKEHLLNYPGYIRTTYDLMNHTLFLSNDQEIFIRPNEDSKSFCGQVIRVGDMKAWFDKLQRSDSDELNMETKVLVSNPVDIQKEWRLWIVQGKVIAASQYEAYGQLNKKEGCPSHVIDFAEEVCKKWTPHNVFCMDVCVRYDMPTVKIVECGCFNSCGFYHADLNQIVGKVSDYFKTII